MSCAGTCTNQAGLSQAGTYVSVLLTYLFALDNSLYRFTEQLDSAQAATLVSVLEECIEYRPQRHATYRVTAFHHGFT